VVGGAASQLNVDHLLLGGSAIINIAPFLGSRSDQVSPTVANIVNLTTTLAAHELGHLSGLQHRPPSPPTSWATCPGCSTRTPSGRSARGFTPA
jgi:hypothetical protein